MLPNFPKPLPEDDRPTNRTVKMDDRLYQYLVDVSVRENDILKALRRETAQYHMARMQLSPEVGQLLALLVKLQAPKKILEVGVFTGYSTLSMAMAMSKDASLIAIEKKQMWLDIATRYLEEAGVMDRVTTYCDKALPVMTSLLETGSDSFDFIFIDADKKNLLAYYERAKQLLRPGGCLLIDNTLWWGNVADDTFTDKDTNIVRALNETIHADHTVDLSLIPIGDGLTLVRKR
ncbi:Putative O-methyltransferase/MSMEI_4947 [Marinomonas spartinae]|uniref:Putative O-methyltransferase/MSMEI_4947 n=1 Tax=Marinomonas spartinae TaxID=1792290 RepID=A0A1A8TME2_9GAMM|nr:class I SAM-dependent methyltransferase [Marinomonas spartinae]SBS34286.1 Putative O-methyltransferase/MSMEI_4947 [Marinomonas spartinae]SBS34883.1 Putative O-methyltransferase/MSMEI_4947 [Marinomonas spartinae]